MVKDCEDTSPKSRSYLKDIAAVCLALRQRADFFLHNEPENLSVEDFDAIAVEMEELARTIDNFVDYFSQES
jgi:hypothetical protein